MVLIYIRKKYLQNKLNATNQYKTKIFTKNSIKQRIFYVLRYKIIYNFNKFNSIIRIITHRLESAHYELRSVHCKITKITIYSITFSL